MRSDVLVIIAASLHGHGVARQPLRILGGQTLLTRAIQAALSVVAHREHIVVVADDDEVALAAERQGISTCHVAAAEEPDALLAAARSMMSDTRRQGESLSAVVILRPVSPLLRPADLESALVRFAAGGSDSLQSACAEAPSGRVPLLSGADTPAGSTAVAAFTPTEAFVVTRPDLLARGEIVGPNHEFVVLPPERGIEILSTRDWWVCERLFERRRIVFVVIGDTAVGLGHVYRASLIAQELVDHDVWFVCPRGSELAADLLTQQKLCVRRQEEGDLTDTILSFSPDVVINDILNTEREYVERLRAVGARVVNFEDLGSGARAADLVVNDIFQEDGAPPNHLNGPSYFCIRDEFLDAVLGAARPEVREVLVTFGGTDAADSTHRVARLILADAARRGIHVSVVIGPGYLHRERLSVLLSRAPESVVELADGTKRMSEYMARADLAFSSAGRTVFELAAMRVPAIIIAANEREETHTFGSAANGFLHLGRADLVSDAAVTAAWTRMLDSADARRDMRDRMSRWDFRDGRARVLAAIRPLLAGTRG